MGTIPANFRKLSTLGGGFVHNTGGLYGCWTGEQVLLGFLVEPQHCNPHNICHGGMLATLADMVGPCTTMYQDKLHGRFLPTVSLQLDYLGSAPLGSWVQAEGQVLRRTKNLVFIQGLIRCNGEAITRISGVYKIGPEARWAGPPEDPFLLLAPQ